MTGLRENLHVEYRDIAGLRPRKANARTHSTEQIRKIAESLRFFGFVNPILLDRGSEVVAGHGRLEAARLLGLRQVPTIELRHLSPDEIRAYAVADNRLAELAGWDGELLAAEFQYLGELDLGFDLSVTGFVTAEIDLLIDVEQSGQPDEADNVPAVDANRQVVTRAGDLWHLGRHAVLCADATKGESFQRVLGRKKAQTVFIDPPYNVPINGHVCGMGRVKHREFAMASGEMSEAEYGAFLKGVFRHLSAFSIDGSIHFVCIDWRHVADVVYTAKGTYSELKNICVWAKDNGGMGSLYRSQHELICVFKNGTAPHVNNVKLGQHGRYRTNVWHYPGVNTLREGRMDELAMHPTVKPVQLVADAILDCSKRGGLVLDCFGGSGTTLIAAEKTGRRGRLIEVDPAYVDLTIERFAKLTGIEAVHAQTGTTFSAVRAERIGEATRPELVSPGEEGCDHA